MDEPTNEVYFEQVQAALEAAGYCQPVIVVDRTRLDRNLDTLLKRVPEGMGVRIVAKSLPSIDLLRYVMDRTGTDRLMTFNLPMLSALCDAMPEADHLLGKPFPVTAAAQFLDECPEDTRSSVQWLIDTNERLEQYEALARRTGNVLRVSLELDVGLHRGGFGPDEHLRAALHRIETNQFLELSGLMGYEAHVAKVPSTGGLRDRAFRSSMDTYSAAVEIVEEVFGAEACAALVRNSAGSMTFPLHRAGSEANEISVGTALLKATDFDLDTLVDFEPAVHIATPILKVLPHTALPGIELVGRAAARLRRRPHRTLFIHGGHWLAKPVHPSGLSNSTLYGRSSNQEMLNLASDFHVEPDDFVFLRPTQTEAVLMQFGDLAIYEDGEIIETWPVLPASA